jgi:hypothetical protein
MLAPAKKGRSLRPLNRLNSKFWTGEENNHTNPWLFLFIYTNKGVLGNLKIRGHLSPDVSVGIPTPEASGLNRHPSSNPAKRDTTGQGAKII